MNKFDVFSCIASMLADTLFEIENASNTVWIDLESEWLRLSWTLECDFDHTFKKLSNTYS